eukprot:scaffold47_cov258-Pinguiococcus_pyrenoidosus.AAC.39
MATHRRPQKWSWRRMGRATKPSVPRPAGEANRRSPGSRRSCRLASRRRCLGAWMTAAPMSMSSRC